jgi:hypothetical protein
MAIVFLLGGKTPKKYKKEIKTTDLTKRFFLFCAKKKTLLHTPDGSRGIERKRA